MYSAAKECLKYSKLQKAIFCSVASLWDHPETVLEIQKKDLYIGFQIHVQPSCQVMSKASMIEYMRRNLFRFMESYGMDVFWISYYHVAGILQNIENRNPVFSGGFHADLSTIMVKKPLFQRFEVRIEGMEPLFDISGNTLIVCDSNGGNNKFF